MYLRGTTTCGIFGAVNNLGRMREDIVFASGDPFLFLVHLRFEYMLLLPSVVTGFSNGLQTKQRGHPVRANLFALQDLEATRDPELLLTASLRLAAAQIDALESLTAATAAYRGESFDLPLGSGSASIRTYINEKPKEDSSTLGLEGARKLASAATTRTATTSGPRCDVSWASGLYINSPPFSLATVTAWNNPTVFVPHFFSAVGIVDNQIALCVDFRPRAEAGYETVLDDGTYPEPTNREMFQLGSTRKEMAELFFTPDAMAWADSLRALPGAEAAKTLPRACAGPMLVDVRLPATDASLAAAAAACGEAAEMWINWMAQAERLDTRKTMLVFAHDAKARAISLASSSAMLEKRFGASAAEVAAADAGPLDISNRGGAMNQAAGDNFGDSEKDASAQDAMLIAAQGGGLGANQGA